MLKSGILNPQLNSLLSRVRHTNTLVIADRGFPFWPEIETVDLSLVDGIPTVLQVLKAIRRISSSARLGWPRSSCGTTAKQTCAAFAAVLGGIPLLHEPHVDFKKRVPQAIGLVRTGDTIQYANMILESA